jgi:ribose-phosphate pyrophosphokinase
MSWRIRTPFAARRSILIRGDCLPRPSGLVGDSPVIVASPDPGGVKQAQLFRETLELTLKRPVSSAFLRSGAVRVVTGDLLAGRWKVRPCRRSTISFLQVVPSREQPRHAGITEPRVYAFAAHGLFCWHRK